MRLFGSLSVFQRLLRLAVEVEEFHCPQKALDQLILAT